MWKKFFNELINMDINDFNEPASESELLKAEEALNIKSPESLKSLTM